VASLYSGENTYSVDEPPGTHTATIETNLEQTGGGDPRIAIALRRYRHRVGTRHWEQTYDPKRPLLSLDDARELVVALNYVLEQADQSRSPRLWAVPHHRSRRPQRAPWTMHRFDAPLR
jgi:hypothetical protein